MFPIKLLREYGYYFLQCKEKSKYAILAGFLVLGLSNIYSDYNSTNTLICKKTKNHQSIIKNCPSIRDNVYYPTCFLPNAIS